MMNNSSIGNDSTLWPTGLIGIDNQGTLIIIDYRYRCSSPKFTGWCLSWGPPLSLSRALRAPIQPWGFKSSPGGSNPALGASNPDRKAFELNPAKAPRPTPLPKPAFIHRSVFVLGTPLPFPGSGGSNPALGAQIQLGGLKSSPSALFRAP